mgnify:CR=1 FL=1
MSNPFIVNPARVPSNYIDRISLTDSVISAFTQGESEYAKYIVGVRGTGKTVMMNYICNKLEEADFVCVKMNPMGDLYDSAISGLKTDKSVLSAFNINLEVETPDNDLWGHLLPSIKAGIKMDVSKQNAADKEVILRELVKELTKRNIKVLFAIDEIYKCDNLAMFALTMQTMVGEGSKAYLLMTGLPDNVRLVQRDKRCSFLARIMEVWTSPLSDFSVSNSYMNIFGIDRHDAKVLASYVKGYSYAYQLLGYILWDEKPESILNEERKLNQRVYMRFLEGLFSAQYDLIWDELTPNERLVMKGIAAAPTDKTEDIIVASGLEAGSYNQTREGLYRKKDLIDCSTHGRVEFTLPSFDEYVRFKYDLE